MSEHDPDFIADLLATIEHLLAEKARLEREKQALAEDLAEAEAENV